MTTPVKDRERAWAPTNPVTSSRGDILIVDDTMESLRALLTMLIDNGYDVRGAQNGATALMVAKAEPPELILLDVMMPAMDGYEVCRRLKADPATESIPVIFISALEEAPDKIKGFAAGGVDFISKPFQVEEVLARLETHLKLSALQRQLALKNDRLEEEIEERERAEAALRRMNDELELRVQERTAALAAANERIQQYSENLEQLVASRTRKLSVLYQVTAVAAESLGLQATLAESLQQVLTVMESEQGAIHLVSDCGKRLELAVQQGLPQAVVGQARSIAVGSQLGQALLDSSRPYRLADETIEPFLRALTDGRDPQAYVGLTLRARSVVVGILSFWREQDSPPLSEDEIALLTSLGEQMGMVVESARLRKQAKKTAVMEERSRLARDLHDSVTQLLYSATLIAAAGRESHQSGNSAQAGKCLAELGDVAQQALKEMRLLIFELRPPSLEREGLIGTLQERLDSVEGRANVSTRLLVDDLPPLVEKAQEAFYYIAQEALNNALKHASASTLEVTLAATQQYVTLTVADNGVGFVPEDVDNCGGLGLVSMRERVALFAGELTVDSAPHEGTRIHARLPIAAITVGGATDGEPWSGPSSVPRE